MIYLDNAATGGFKPRAVSDITETVIKYLSANPGRSGHRLSVMGTKIVYSCREKLAKMFSLDEERVVFTKNCTEALNTAIFGTLQKGKKVITTVFEHNSVLRPLYYLQKRGDIILEIVRPSMQKDIAKAIEEKIDKNTYLVVCTAVSNVTGESMPLSKIGEICNEKGVLFLVDGAQGVGHIPISIKKDKISMLALAGHKGLYGIMGSGALCFDNEVEINPFLFGGTGTDSFLEDMPKHYPERLEAGTLNLPAIASLKEGVEYVEKHLLHFAEQTEKSTERIIAELSKINGVTVYSLSNPSGIVSFRLNNTDSFAVADILSRDYDIAVRGGFHCAPLTHKYLKTEDGGLVRASITVQNSSHEIAKLIDAIYELSKKLNVF